MTIALYIYFPSYILCDLHVEHEFLTSKNILICNYCQYALKSQGSIFQIRSISGNSLFQEDKMLMIHIISINIDEGELSDYMLIIDDIKLTLGRWQ